VNKKQRILTVVALIVFIALGALHYLRVEQPFAHSRGLPWWYITEPKHAIVSDVKMPWFTLGVIYAALFFLLQNRRGGS
jgi:hypothetical protein